MKIFGFGVGLWVNGKKLEGFGAGFGVRNYAPAGLYSSKQLDLLENRFEEQLDLMENCFEEQLDLLEIFSQEILRNPATISVFLLMD